MNNLTKTFFYSLIILSMMIEYTYKGIEFILPYIKEYSKKGIAVIITFAILVGEGVEHLYNHREYYLTEMNKFRNMVGSYFVYDTVALA